VVASSASVGLWGMTPQSYFVRNVVKFFTTYLLKSFASGAQFFINSYGFFSHFLVGILRTASQQEVLPLGHAFVTIRVETYAQ